MHQVGYLQRLYRDTRSTEHKTSHSCQILIKLEFWKQ